MSIFEFESYVNFLKYHFKKTSDAKVSHMAQHTQIHQSYLSHVLHGNRHLSYEQALEVCHYLDFTDLERDYFCNLVLLERSGSEKLRRHLNDKLASLKAKSLELSQRVPHQKQLAPNEQAEFYSSWLYSAVRMYLSTADGGRTFDEVVKAFNLSRNKTEVILGFLLNTGLAEKENERYRLGTQATFISKDSKLLRQHHTNWRLKALELYENLSDEEMMFTGPLSVGEKDFTTCREILAKALSDISKIVRESDAETVACLSIDFIKIRPS